MKYVGIIAEFNPFHNGHKYLIEQAKQITNSDCAVILMSPDYVQRGTPSIWNQYQRANIAVQNGADIILQMPVEIATSSSRNFADGCVSILNNLGINNIVFGSEIDDNKLIYEIADVIANEPSNLSNSISNFIKKGLSYPKALELSLTEFNHKYSTIYNSNQPNVTLGIQYIAASIKHNYNIKFNTIKRIGDNYNLNSSNLSATSSSSIRSAILDNDNIIYKPITIDDYTLIFKEKLIKLDSNDLVKYCDVNSEIANLIFKYRNDFTSITDLLTKIKSRNYTYTRLSRCIIHIILGITDDNFNQLENLNYKSYVKLLSINSKSLELIDDIKTNSNIPIIINNKDISILDENALDSYKLNHYATMLYESVYSTKYNKPIIIEETRKLDIV